MHFRGPFGFSSKFWFKSHPSCIWVFFLPIFWEPTRSSCQLAGPPSPGPAKTFFFLHPATFFQPACYPSPPLDLGVLKKTPGQADSPFWCPPPVAQRSALSSPSTLLPSLPQDDTWLALYDAAEFLRAAPFPSFCCGTRGPFDSPAAPLTLRDTLFGVRRSAAAWWSCGRLPQSLVMRCHTHIQCA